MVSGCLLHNMGYVAVNKNMLLTVAAHVWLSLVGYRELALSACSILLNQIGRNSVLGAGLTFWKG